MKIITFEQAKEILLDDWEIWISSGGHYEPYHKRVFGFLGDDTKLDEFLINNIDDFSCMGVPLMTQINLYDDLDGDVENLQSDEYYFEESKFSYYISKKVNFQKIIAAINAEDYSILAEMNKDYFIMAENSSKLAEDFYEIAPVTAAKMVKQGIVFRESNENRERMLLNLGQYLSNDFSELSDILDSLLSYHGDKNVSIDEVNENIILFQPFENWNYSELMSAL